MSNRLPHLATRLFNTPLAIHPRKVEVVMAALAERFGVVSLDNFAPRPQAMEDDDYGFSSRGREETHGYEVINGVAVIEVAGTLVNKLGTLRPYSGMTGYDGIRQNYLTALSDRSVKGIVLDCESPGGEVAGCFDLVDEIFNARGTKPCWAILSEYAYSAGFAIASAADKIMIPRTGGAGSVGVVCMHVDYSKAIKEAGIKVSFITYGENKVDGRPEIPLSDEALARFQKDVDTMGELFCGTVARNLNMSMERVISTQAGTFMGADAVQAGFAHAVMSPDEAFRSFVSKL